MRCVSRVPRCVLVLCLLAALLCGRAANAQDAPPAASSRAVEPRHEAEQNLINLATVQPLRRYPHHVRSTHRFARDLTLGRFEEIASDLFGLDSGSLIGLHYRFAPLSNVQLGIYRTTSHSDERLRHDLWADRLGGERSNIHLGFNLARNW